MAARPALRDHPVRPRAPPGDRSAPGSPGRQLCAVAVVKATDRSPVWRRPGAISAANLGNFKRPQSGKLRCPLTITKLKLVKRQMYGRGKIDLLEARVVGVSDA